MDEDINVGQLTDREILVLLAHGQKTTNTRLNNHGERIKILEGVAKMATGAIAIVSIVAGWFKIQANVKQG